MEPTTAKMAAHSSRSSIDRLLITDLACRSTTSRETANRPRFRKVANHTPLNRTPETANGDDLARSSPSAVLFLAQVCWPVGEAAGAPGAAPGPGPAPGVAPSVRCKSGNMAWSCEPQYGQSCVPLASKLNTALWPPALLYASWNFRLLVRTKPSRNLAGRLSPPRSDCLPLPQYIHRRVLLATVLLTFSSGSLRDQAGSSLGPHMSAGL